MGLDNGIYVKGLNIPEEFTMFNFEYDNSVEIAYWRKFWGIRDEIVHYLNGKYNTDSYNTFDWKLDKDDITEIICIQYRFLNKDYFYDNEASTIWSYSEAIGNMGRNLINMMWLRKNMGKNTEIVFYDSY